MTDSDDELRMITDFRAQRSGRTPQILLPRTILLYGQAVNEEAERRCSPGALRIALQTFAFWI